MDRIGNIAAAVLGIILFFFAIYLIVDLYNDFNNPPFAVFLGNIIELFFRDTERGVEVVAEVGDTHGKIEVLEEGSKNFVQDVGLGADKVVKNVGLGAETVIDDVAIGTRKVVDNIAKGASTVVDDVTLGADKLIEATAETIGDSVLDISKGIEVVGDALSGTRENLRKDKKKNKKKKEASKQRKPRRERKPIETSEIDDEPYYTSTHDDHSYKSSTKRRDKHYVDIYSTDQVPRPRVNRSRFDASVESNFAKRHKIAQETAIEPPPEYYSNGSSDDRVYGQCGKPPVGGSQPGPPVKRGPKEVFNIDKNVFSYDQADRVCKAFGAELATYGQVKKAYKNGANWCNYGWSQDQMALYPIQNSFYEKLQEGPPKDRDNCGVPGVNGGYFDDPSLKFGVNCYGYKPNPNPDTIVYADQPEYDTIANDAYTTDQLRQMNIDITPFSDNKWSCFSTRPSVVRDSPSSVESVFKDQYNNPYATGTDRAHASGSSSSQSEESSKKCTFKDEVIG